MRVSVPFDRRRFAPSRSDILSNPSQVMSQIHGTSARPRIRKRAKVPEVFSYHRNAARAGGPRVPLGQDLKGSVAGRGFEPRTFGL
jgi:hypothetical protein